MKNILIILFLLVSFNGFSQGGFSPCCCGSSASITTTTTNVVSSKIAKASVSGDSNQPNNTLTLSSLRQDAGIVISGTSMTNNLGGDYAVIDVQNFYEEPLNTDFQRIAPELELLKNGAVVAKSATAYQRHGTGHDASSNGISYTDHNPTVGDVWQIRAQQGSNQNDILDVDIGHFTLNVYELVSVINTVQNN